MDLQDCYGGCRYLNIVWPLVKSCHYSMNQLGFLLESVQLEWLVLSIFFEDSKELVYSFFVVLVKTFLV